MTICELCQQEIKGIMMSCSKGSLCPDCQKNIGLAEHQPTNSYSCILWCLAETYFRLGKGEKTSFEKVWKENKNFKLVTFEELIKGGNIL